MTSWTVKYNIHLVGKRKTTSNNHFTLIFFSLFSSSTGCIRGATRPSACGGGSSGGAHSWSSSGGSKAPPPLLSLPTGGSTSNDAGSATPRLHFVMFSKSAYIRIFSLPLPVVHGLSEGTESTVNVLSEKVDLLKKVFDSLTMPHYVLHCLSRCQSLGSWTRSEDQILSARSPTESSSTLPMVGDHPSPVNTTHQLLHLVSIVAFFGPHSHRVKQATPWEISLVLGASCHFIKILSQITWNHKIICAVSCVNFA